MSVGKFKLVVIFITLFIASYLILRFGFVPMWIDIPISIMIALVITFLVSAPFYDKKEELKKEWWFDNGKAIVLMAGYQAPYEGMNKPVIGSDWWWFPNDSGGNIMHIHQLFETKLEAIYGAIIFAQKKQKEYAEKETKLVMLRKEVEKDTV